MKQVTILIHNNRDKKISKPPTTQNDIDGVVGKWLEDFKSDSSDVSNYVIELKTYLISKGATIVSENKNTEYQTKIVIEIPIK